MRTIVLALLVTLTLATLVLPAAAGPPAEQLRGGRAAGRSADGPARELRRRARPAVAARDARVGQAAGSTGRSTSDPADRPLITIMLHHRSELGLSPEQVSRLEAVRGDFCQGGDPPGRRHPDRRARPCQASRAGAAGLHADRGEGAGVGPAARRPPHREASRGRAGQGRADARAADSAPDDAERRDAAWWAQRGTQRRTRASALRRHGPAALGSSRTAG